MANSTDDTFDDNNATIAPGQTQTVQATQSLSIEGTLTNQGTVQASAGPVPNFQGGFNYYGSKIDINGPVVLTGGGTVRLVTVAIPNSGGGTAYGTIEGYYGGNTGAIPGIPTLDNVNDTIDGAGLFSGYFGLATTNEVQGTIDADDMTFPLTVGVYQGGNVFNNKGLFESTAAGGLDLVSAKIDNTGGTIRAVGSGNIVDIDGSTIKGGTLSTSGGGLIEVQDNGNSGTATLDGTGTGGITLSAGSVLQVNDGQELHLSGTATTASTIVNNGTIDFAGTNGGKLDIDNSVVLRGGGTVALASTKFIEATTAGSTLENVDNTISGAGTIESSNNLAIANDAGGTIQATGANPLNVQAALSNSGTLSASAGSTLNLSGADTLGGTVAGAGTVVVGSNSTITGLTLAGTLDLTATAGTGTVTYAGKGNAAATLMLEKGAQPTSGGTFGNTLASFGDNDALDLRGLAFTNALGATYNPLNGQLSVNENGTTELFNLANPGATTFVAKDDGQGGTMVTDAIAIVCFCSGTRIATVRGDVTVEDLVIGDCVVTAAGEHRPIRWLGHRMVDCRRHPRPSEVMPVRVAAHAFGENRPARDLLVSPGHALCVDVLGEVLIPAAALINGATVVQEHVERATYWHVELESHDILLAENLPCESYFEMGNRGFFAGGDVVSLDAAPDARVVTHADFCRAFHGEGALVAFVRGRLAVRAMELGWRLEEASLADDLHLEVDGVRVRPDVRGLCARFLVPAGARDVWLVCGTAVPAHMNGSDLRALGICLGALTIDDGFGAPRMIVADDPRLCVGFHEAEPGPQRWTASRARLPAELWDGTDSAFFLRLDTTRPALPRWIGLIDKAQTSCATEICGPDSCSDVYLRSG